MLITAGDLVHVAAALVLLTCAVMILALTLSNLLRADIKSLLHVLNDVLLALIVMELLWPVLAELGSNVVIILLLALPLRLLPPTVTETRIDH